MPLWEAAAALRDAHLEAGGTLSCLVLLFSCCQGLSPPCRGQQACEWQASDSSIQLCSPAFAHSGLRHTACASAMQIDASQANTGQNHAISALKFKILREFLQLGWNVLLSDIDVVVIQVCPRLLRAAGAAVRSPMVELLPGTPLLL